MTLVLKAVAYQWQPARVEPELFGKTVTSFLHQNGFETRLEKDGFGQVFVHANAGNCRMLISEVVPQGWNLGIVKLLAEPVGKMRYVFDGAVMEHEPIIAPVIDEYWRRVRIKMGFNPSHHPVLAVAASDDCSVNALPWRELSVLF